MKRILALSCAFLLVSAGLGYAGEMTSGLEVSGGQNAFAQLRLERAEQMTQEDGMLKLVVTVTQAQELKGYGFVLNYDPAKFEFVEAKEVDGNLLATGEQSTLFLSSNRNPGQVMVGAMKVDGQAASGEGNLVAFTFKTIESPLPTDFQVTEGVLVDLGGSIDAVQHVEIGDLKLKPDTYLLNQNMPNPFNPSTSIAYQLPERAAVTLVVYNLLGQEVRTLVDEAMDAGYYKMTWDGRDAVGRQVASGIYIYRLKAGNFTHARRMMLLK